jgi:adenine-specific DNA-methyltransferase
MTTDPGDLVLDPTCGSGTTAFVAEQWGRRWVTLDTSRVAVTIARQRLLTAQFEQYRVRAEVPDGAAGGQSNDPGKGFVYRTVPRVSLGSIAHNQTLDPILERHEAALEGKLAALNAELGSVPQVLKAKLGKKLRDKEQRDGKRAITDSDRRMWLLPDEKWERWQVPFDADAEWPERLKGALANYRSAWSEKMTEVNACIATNAEQVELRDQPQVVKGTVRVSGPFTVEGVRPEELNLSDEGLFAGAPTEFGSDMEAADVRPQQNLRSYLSGMVHYIRQDGLTFLNNQRQRFAVIEPLFEDGTGTDLHAEGAWEGSEPATPASVAIVFGPQYGPVTVQQVVQAIHACPRYKELVVAGFSFDAAATAIIQEQSHPKLRIHQAYIRPDINPGMEGLLKETPNSQLFTVFGTPEIAVVKNAGDEWVVDLKGVDIYDPVANTVRSTGAEKVAAWFLDSDFDGRCFCVTQAFFPDQDAWEKVAKALGSAANADAFEAFEGTTSIPFTAGAFNRIAVKVIDPRGNEVMVVRALES